MDWWMDLGAGVIGGLVGAGVWVVIVVVHDRIESYRDRKWIEQHKADFEDCDD